MVAPPRPEDTTLPRGIEHGHPAGRRGHRHRALSWDELLPEGGHGLPWSWRGRPDARLAERL